MKARARAAWRDVFLRALEQG
ncbi:MAG: hypothetical protein AVDCRST_MAG91-591, partial [uncultured Sphingomonadaceae bacterium]